MTTLHGRDRPVCSSTIHASIAHGNVVRTKPSPHSWFRKTGLHRQSRESAPERHASASIKTLRSIRRSASWPATARPAGRKTRTPTKTTTRSRRCGATWPQLASAPCSHPPRPRATAPAPEPPRRRTTSPSASSSRCRRRLSRRGATWSGRCSRRAACRPCWRITPRRGCPCGGVATAHGRHRRAARGAHRRPTRRGARRRRHAQDAAVGRRGDARAGRGIADRRRYDHRTGARGSRPVILDGWRAGGRKLWTMPEIERLRAAYAKTPSAVAIWRSGESPDRTLSAISARLVKSRISSPAGQVDGRRIVGLHLGLEHRQWMSQFGPCGASAAARRLIDAEIARGKA